MFAPGPLVSKNGKGGSEKECDTTRRKSFDEWLDVKQKLDKGLALFFQLDPSRANSDFLQVATALAAVDRSMGFDAESSLQKRPISTETGPGGGGAGLSSKSMYSAFKKWAQRHHAFTDVQVLPTELKMLSSDTQSLLEENRTTSSSSENRMTVLPVLQWKFPSETLKNDLEVKTLTEDQKIGNSIFLRLLRDVWNTAHDIVSQKLTELLVKSETLHRQKERTSNKFDTESHVCEEKHREEGEVCIDIMRIGLGEEEKEWRGEEKKWDGGGAKQNGKVNLRVKGHDGCKSRKHEETSTFDLFKKYERDAGFQDRKSKYAKSAMHMLGIGRLKVLLKQDNDRKNEQKHQEEVKRVEEARRVHRAWVKRKDREHVKSVRYVNTLGRGVEGLGEDLKQDHQYRQVLKSCKEKEERKEGSKKAYIEWTQQKNLVEKALSELSHIDPPPLPSLTTDKAKQQESVSLWLKVGKALKQVDCRLIKEFIDWSGDAFPHVHCQIVWDSFPPIACDIHAPGHNIVRETLETLLKLLHQSQMNDHTSFEKMMQRHHKRVCWNQDVSERGRDDIALTKKDIESLLTNELGISIQEEQLRILVGVLDKTNNEIVSWQDFEEFIGGGRRGTKGGDASKQIKQWCLWHSTCRLTGTPNAYSFKSSIREKGEKEYGPTSLLSGAQTEHKISNRTPSNRCKNEKHCKVSLPARCKRIELLRTYGLLLDNADIEICYDKKRNLEKEDIGNKFLQVKCQAATWGINDKRSGLGILSQLAKPNKAANERKMLLEKGEPPPAPMIWLASADDHSSVGSVQNRHVFTQEMLLCWKLAPEFSVTFVSLEMSGAEGSQAFQQREFHEVFRDPSSLYEDPEGQVWIQNLQSDTKYGFRIRAFNEFGPGPYVHKYFSALPSTPQPPVLIKAGSTELHLKWLFNECRKNWLQELKAIFEQLECDGSGNILREELLIALASNHRSLLHFLKARSVPTQCQHSTAFPLTVFDSIESNDKKTISWEAFLKYFGGVSNDLDEGSQSSSKDFESMAQNNHFGKVGARGKYVLEQCICEKDDTWVERCHGMLGEAIIKGLSPGCSYRFRVCKESDSGERGPSSGSTVFNTLVAIPAAPCLAGTNLNTKSVQLNWGAHTAAGHPAMRWDSGKAIMTEWSNSGPVDDGVNVRLCLSRHDRNGNQCIGTSELKSILKDLGVNTAEVILDEFVQELKTSNSDENNITFEEFEEWWNNTEKVVYTIRHDAGVGGPVCEAILALRGTSNFKQQDALAITALVPPSTPYTTSYHGSDTSCNISGPNPNTLYTFRLDVLNVRAMSPLSPPLAVMTSPSRPTAPCAVRIDSRCIVLKWYPSTGGAHTFILGFILVEKLKSGGGNMERVANVTPRGGTSRTKKNREWSIVYKGADNIINVNNLASSTVYHFRVAAVNIVGNQSAWSDVTQVTTAGRDVCFSWKPENAAELFTMDCNGDVSVGDSIIFTERLYVDGRSKSLIVPGSMDAPHSMPGNNRTTRKTRMNGSLSHPSISVTRTAAPGGEFVGERTIAGHLLSDSLHRMRRKDITEGGSGVITYDRDAMSSRTLRLEVVWSTVSRPSAEEFRLPKNTIIERTEIFLSQFEMFRVPWIDEMRRLTVNEEWKL